MDEDEDEEDTHCPLCVEELDLSDQNFLPCPCGYKVCKESGRFLPFPDLVLIPANRNPLFMVGVHVVLASYQGKPERALPRLQDAVQRRPARLLCRGQTGVSDKASHCFGDESTGLVCSFLSTYVPSSSLPTTLFPISELYRRTGSASRRRSKKRKLRPWRRGRKWCRVSWTAGTCTITASFSEI